MKKIILLIIFIVIVSVAGGIYYFNAVVLPQKLRTLADEKGREFLGRQISYGKIEFNFGRGIRISDVKVKRKDDPDQVFFSAKEISSNIPLLPLIKEKKVIMPSIRIKGFFVYAQRNGKGLWNLSDLLSKKASPQESPFEILLGKIIMQNGEVRMTDQLKSFDPMLLTVTKIEAALKLPQKIQVIFSGEIKDSQTSLDVNGDYFLADQSIKMKARAANLDILKRIAPFVNIQTPLEEAFVKDADVNIIHNIEKTECRGDITASIKANLQDLRIEGEFRSQKTAFSMGKKHLYTDADHLTINNAVLHFKDDFTLTGILNAEKLALTKKNGSFSIGGNITADNASLTSKDIAIHADKLKVGELLFEQNLPEKKVFQTTTITAAIDAESLKADIKKTRISGDLNVPKFTLTLEKEQKKAEFPFSLTSAEISHEGILRAQGDFQTDFVKLQQTKQALTISGLTHSDRITFALPQGRTGRVTAKSDFRVIKNLTKLAELTYKIDTEIEDGRLSNAFLPYFEQLDNIRGKISVVNENIYFENLLLDTRQTTVGITGELRTFSKLISELKIEAKDLDIQEWLPLMQSYIEPYGISIDGHTDIAVHIRGPLLDGKKPDFSVESKLQKANIRSSRYPYSLHNAYGLLKYKQDLLSWNDLDFEFNDEDYSSTGTLKNFKEPLFNIKLEGPQFFLSLNAENKNGELDISRADLKTKRTNLSGQGMIRLDKEDPYGNLRIHGSLSLSDLKRVHPLMKQRIDEFGILGEGVVDLSYRGPLKRPFDAALTIVYQTPYTSIKGLRFDNATLQLDQPTPEKTSFTLSTGFYNGSVNANGYFRTKDPWPLTAQAKAFDIDIAELQKDLAFKKQNLSGILSANIYIDGPIKKTQDITGQGKIEINQAYFAQPVFLSGILKILLNPNYHDLIFTDGKAKLFIRNNKLKIMDIILISKSVDLTGYGWIDINKNINFTISPSFKDSLYIKSSKLSSGTEGLLEKYGSVHVTGTLTEPKYSSNITPENIVEDAADIISGGMEGFIKNLGF